MSGVTIDVPSRLVCIAEVYYRYIDILNKNKSKMSLYCGAKVMLKQMDAVIDQLVEMAEEVSV